MKSSLIFALCLCLSSLSAGQATKDRKTSNPPPSSEPVENIQPSSLPPAQVSAKPIENIQVQATTPPVAIVEPSFPHIENYLFFLEKHLQTLGPLGDRSKGEIEIVTDPLKIVQIEQMMGRKTGLVYQDKYWMWINDPVQFPNGSYGIYGRLISNRSLESKVVGAAVLTLTPEGKIALLRNYRHATRSWEYELPRGSVNSGETLEAAAAREVQEETGMVLSEIRNLGEMAGDTGMTNSPVALFFAKTVKSEQATPDSSEAIASVDTFTLQQIKKGLSQGYLKVESGEETLTISLRDPFLAFAILQAETKGFLPKSKRRPSPPPAANEGTP
jgi:ADP-ribose pyrophosphatase